MNEDDEFFIDLDMMTHFADLKEFLSKNAPKCSECTTDQVQLISYWKEAPEWKCRICEHKFEFMPEGFRK